jgi:hypothetical protein
MLLIVALSLGLVTAVSALESPKIDRRREPTDWGRGKLAAVARYDPNSTNAFQVDLRGYDLSGLDLTDRAADLLHCSFDDGTKWPGPGRMPEGFDPERIMTLGKNPGLGIRALHARGITGRGVGLAILDQPLLVDHQEYADRIHLYEEIDLHRGMPASMHGSAVASIAVGKTVGVAPEADLYYIGQFNGERVNGEFVWTFESLARGVNRILEINEQLPPGRKIRVISISVGWSPSQKGYQQIRDAAAKAKAAGMLVICSSVEKLHGFRFHGLGRHPLADPDDFTVYGPGSWWARLFDQGSPTHTKRNRLLAPMDARTAASPTGVGEYVFYGDGGWSWSIPYIAGVYALAAQVEPSITSDRFWALALETGRTIDLQRRGKKHRFGPILDAAALVEAIRRGELTDETAVAAALAKYYPPTMAEPLETATPEELAARIDRLNIGSATRQDVVAQLGEPVSYVLGAEKLDVNDLPSRYAMIYPGGVHTVVINDRLQRISIFTPGYRYRGAIQVGTSMQEALKVLGSPRKTIEGVAYSEIRDITEDNVLLDRLNGVAGNALYRNEAEGLTLHFRDGRVAQIMLLPKPQPGQTDQ